MLFKLNLAFETSLLVDRSRENVDHIYDNIRSEIDKYIEK